MEPKLIATLGIFFIFLMTTLGSAVVFFFKNKISGNINRAFLGFAAGVMIAASVWSLIIPSIDRTEATGGIGWIPALIGFLIGGVFLLVIDHILPHLHPQTNTQEGVKNSFQRTTLLFLAVTIHNIPEGLAVGLAFGLALQNQMDPSLMVPALGLAIGIGLQNFPEGAAISLPLKNEGISNKKSFLIGTASGVVEPFAAVIGLLLASVLPVIMPWFLAFAAGAMVYVVIEELVPEAQLNSKSHIGTISFMIGFAIMMVLDVALG
jgi:ZIP family zinc transporter